MVLPGRALGDDAARADYREFVRRYQDGHPAEGYSDREVLQRYSTVAGAVSDAEYEMAAREAFERMEPGDWTEIGERLHQGARAHGIELPDLGPPAGGRPIRLPDSAAQPGTAGPVFDPPGLARLAGRLHQQPGLLRQSLAAPALPDAEHGLLAGPPARAALAGITAHLVRRALEEPSSSPGRPPTPTHEDEPPSTRAR